MKKSNLAKNTLLLSIGEFLTKGLSFIMVPFYSRWLSTADYGSFDLMCTYVTLLLPVIGLASNEALFRFSMDVESDEEKKEYVSNCWAIFSSNSFLLLLVMLGARVIFGWTNALYFYFLALGQIYNLYFRGYLRAIKHLDIYSFVNAITTVCIAFFTTIFVFLLNFGLKGILLGYGMGYILGDLLIFLYTKYWHYFSFKLISFNGCKKLVSYSYALIPNSIAWWFINVSDRTIIRLVLGATANGIYAIAYKIPNILSSVFGVFSVSWQQSATEALNDADRNKYYNSVYNKMVVVLLPLCCGILSLNSWLFNYVFDVSYYEGYLYSPILVGGTFFATLSQFYGSLQISFKNPKENGVTTVIGAAANLFIHLALIRFVGLYAAAISTIVSQIIVCILRKRRLNRWVNLKFDRTSIICFVIYLYFSCSAYYISNFAFNIMNVVIASATVIIFNREYVKKVLNRLGLR